MYGSTPASLQHIVLRPSVGTSVCHAVCESTATLSPKMSNVCACVSKPLPLPASSLFSWQFLLCSGPFFFFVLCDISLVLLLRTLINMCPHELCSCLLFTAMFAACELFICGQRLASDSGSASACASACASDCPMSFSSCYLTCKCSDRILLCLSLH